MLFWTSASCAIAPDKAWLSSLIEMTDKDLLTCPALKWDNNFHSFSDIRAQVRCIHMGAFILLTFYFVSAKSPLRFTIDNFCCFTNKISLPDCQVLAVLCQRLRREVKFLELFIKLVDRAGLFFEPKNDFFVFKSIQLPKISWIGQNGTKSKLIYYLHLLSFLNGPSLDSFSYMFVLFN